MNTYKTVENLHKLMKASGDNQVTLSANTGVQQSTLQRILKGLIQYPKLNQLVPICDYYSITLDELIGRSENIDLESAKLIKAFNALSPEDKAIFMLALEAKVSSITHDKGQSKRSELKHIPKPA